jgi:hypothetical protein
MITDLELERLRRLRKDAFALQAHYESLLCGDDEEETELQRKFGLLLWEIDELIRERTK